MENFVEHLKGAEVKQQNLQDLFDQASSQASSILQFTLQWEELQNDFECAKECLLAQARELTLQQKTLEEKSKQLNRWSEEVEMRSMSVEEKLNEVEAREREKDLFEKRIEECRLELKSLQEVSRELGNKEGKLRSSISNFSCELERKEEELNKVDNSLKCLNSELKLKEMKMKTLQDLLECCSEQVEIKLKELKGVEMSLDLCSKNLDSAQKKSEEAENLTKQHLDEVNLKEEELQTVKELIGKNSEELASNLSRLHKMKEQIQENTYRLQEQEKKCTAIEEAISILSTKHALEEIELSIVQCLIEESLRNLRLKVDHLDSLTFQIQNKTEQLQLMENQSMEMQMSVDMLSAKIRMSVEQDEEVPEKGKPRLEPVQKSVQECFEELRTLMAQDDSTRKLFVWFCTELKSKEKELNFMKKLFEDYHKKVEYEEPEMKSVEKPSKEPQERERRCDSLDSSLSKSSEELHIKERQLDQHLKNIELKAKRLNEMRQSFQEVVKEVELGLELSSHVNNSKGLMQHEGSETPDLLQDPAEVVLALVNHLGFSANKLGSRILILERLLEVSPVISPGLKDASNFLADRWQIFCEQIQNPVEVLAFLLFMIAYGLVSDLNCNKILGLIRTVSRHKPAPAVCRYLCFTDEIPGFIKMLMRRKKHLGAATARLVAELLPELAWQQYLDEARVAWMGGRGEGSNEAQDCIMDNEAITLRAILNFMAEYISEFVSVSEDLIHHVAQHEREACRMLPSPSHVEVENFQLQPKKKRRMTAESVG